MVEVLFFNNATVQHVKSMDFDVDTDFLFEAIRIVQERTGFNLVIMSYSWCVMGKGNGRALLQYIEDTDNEN